jgi:hypothetical protein
LIRFIKPGPYGTASSSLFIACEHFAGPRRAGCRGEGSVFSKTGRTSTILLWIEPGGTNIEPATARCALIPYQNQNEKP